MHEMLESCVSWWHNSQYSSFCYQSACLAEHVHGACIEVFPLSLVERVFMQNTRYAEYLARPVAFDEEIVPSGEFVA